MSENNENNEWSDFGSICPQCGCLGSWIDEGNGRWRCKCCGFIQESRNDYAPPIEEGEEERRDDRDIPPVAEMTLFDYLDEDDDLSDFELGND